MSRVLILGGGVAGLSAAIYTSRARLETLVFLGSQPGGQLTTTSLVENYPGFSQGILGPLLTQEMQKQAEKFGAVLLNDQVIKVNFSTSPFLVETASQKFSGEVVIVATGASPRNLGLEEEKQFVGRGLSYCATCDGPLFKNKNVGVVGGGDSALEEALFLTNFAQNVYLIHRRDAFRASKILQERVFSNPKIKIVFDSVVEKIQGEKFVSGVEVRNVKSGEVKTLELQGLFVAIGLRPNTEIFHSQLELDENGFILTKPFSSATSRPGVFAAGDCVHWLAKQAIIAAGSGAQAALEAKNYLENLEKKS